MFVVKVLMTVALRMSSALPSPPDDPGGLVERYCGDDKAEYCAGVLGPHEIMQCLENHKSDISSGCVGFIGTAERGACNNEAYQLCSEFIKAEDIIHCLKQHEDEISQACRENLYAHEKVLTNRNQQMRLNQLRVTEFITITSIAYLLVQLALALWALLKFRDLYAIYTSMDTNLVRVGSSHAVGCADMSATASDSDDSFQSSSLPMEVTFMGLSFWIRHNRSWTKPLQRAPCVRVLHRVAGRFIPGQVSAIMGPSGSGKTTLLKLLAGRMCSGEVDGIRAINGEIISARDYDENKASAVGVMYNRFDDGWIDSAIFRAKRIMQEMGLTPVTQSVVGGGAPGIAAVTARGISGGQRRRLSIAQELLGKPRVIFLDEPTSGLDAHTSLQLMAVLHRLSRRENSTLVLTIHQPRSEVFSMFDSLILLGQGGHMVYSGQSKNALSLLSSCPQTSLNSADYDNPGDFIIDMLGLAESENEESSLLSGRRCPVVTSDSRAKRFNGDEVSARDQHDSTLLSSRNTRGRDSTLQFAECVTLDDVAQCASLSNMENTLCGTDNVDQRRQFVRNETAAKVLADHFYHSLSYVSIVRDIEGSMSQGIVQRQRQRKSKSMSPTTSDDRKQSAQLLSRAREMIAGGLLGLQQSSQQYTQLDPTDVVDEVEMRSMNRLATTSPFAHSFSQSQSQTPLSVSLSSEISDDFVTAETTDADSGDNNGNSDEEDEVILNSREGPAGTGACNRTRIKHSKSHLTRNWKKHKGQSKYGFMYPPILSDEFIGRGDTKGRGGWWDRILLQLWVLYSRRLTTFHPRISEVLSFSAQNIAIAIVISLAFSYDVNSELERPYQVFMLIFILSSYAMILQYLTLVPEYFIERPVVSMERASGVLSYGPYIISSLLSEVPRAILQCCLLLGIVYIIHPLNPTTANSTFAFVCLMVGVCAWQSVICICSVVSDNISVAYTVSFLILGAGTLFGGLLVGLRDIPQMFRFVYYMSVTAVTQRALVVNDMECCYLSVTCNSLAGELAHRDLSVGDMAWTPLNFGYRAEGVDRAEYTSQFDGPEGPPPSGSFCPPQLHFTGDGSDDGNLGRFALQILNLENTTPIISLFFLFWANLICRCVAIIILSVRERLKYELVQVDEDAIVHEESNRPTSNIRPDVSMHDTNLSQI